MEVKVTSKYVAWEPVHGSWMSCTKIYERPAGWLRLRLFAYRRYSDGSVRLCWNTALMYNGSPSSDYSRWASNRNASGQPKCGNGDYKAHGQTHAFQNNAWRGGTLPTSYHYFQGVSIGPARHAAPTGSVMKDPITLAERPDGSVDVSKLPERIEIAGPDGRAVRNARGAVVTVALRRLYSGEVQMGATPSSPRSSRSGTEVIPHVFHRGYD